MTLPAVVEVVSLSKSFRQGDLSVEVLKGLDFAVHEGETVAIVGQSGSGKSTLLAMLAGLDLPTAGAVRLDGTDLASLSEEKVTRFRSEKMGIVFQQFHLMSSLTALENVGLPLEIRGERDFSTRASAALNQVGLGHRLKHFPSQLSGGECQRVAIARSIVTNPRILLADEPSGNLDGRTGEQVMDLLFSLVRDRRMTMILVTHNHDLAAKCDRIMLLEHGQVHQVRETPV